MRIPLHASVVRPWLKYNTKMALCCKNDTPGKPLKLIQKQASALFVLPAINTKSTTCILKVERGFDSLRSNPRFVALVKKVGIP